MVNGTMTRLAWIPAKLAQPVRRRRLRRVAWVYTTTRSPKSKFRTKRPAMRRMILTLLAACLAAPAQSPQGTIVGRVTDASQAVVVGVRVTVMNEETQVARAATTNEAGEYVVSFLPVGVYEVTMEAQGFTKSVHISKSTPPRPSVRMPLWPSAISQLPSR